MIIPEGLSVTFWCSLFCGGNEATGELTVEEAPGEFLAIPICDECKEKIESRLDRPLEGMVN